MRTALILISALFATTAFAGRLQEVKSLLERSVYACPERIWDGLDWKKARITLLSSEQKQGIILQNGDVKNADIAQVDSLKSHFDFEENGIVINVDALPSAQEAFALVVHEGFHSFGQKNLPYQTDGRDDIYPASYEPRLEREELSRALIGFFRGEVGSLERAVEWQRRHAVHKEKLGSDVIEGSAEYVEKISVAISQLGCGASEIALVQSAVDAIAEQGASFDKSLEHYRIGALSFLLARPKLEYVLKQLDGEKLPLDLALEGVVPNENVVADTLLEYAIESSVSMANKQAEATILPVKEAIANKQTLVFVPFKGLRGSFMHAGSYLAEGKTYYQNLELETARGQVNGNGMQAEACNAQGFLVVVEKLKEEKSTSSFEGAPVICY